EQNLLNTIGENKGKDSKTQPVKTRELQKKIPVDPQQEQLILDLEQVETVSNSQIKSMDFTNKEQTETQTDENNNGIGNSVQQNSNEAEKQNLNNPLPTGVQKLTVQLNVESPGYEEFEKFIDALEKLKRIVVVESIDYAAGNEQTTLAELDKPFSYTLTISAFYMPGLTDLENQMPEIDVPNPAEKQNPLSQFPEITTP
ncbi:MAG TPA: pilus assembly protein PilO, partial [Bacillales bacterium]|nr:pilus assembly protein PilO [Bacillales bacterium]